MNYLFPLDTYFAAPLSEIFTDKFAMPVVKSIHSNMANFTQFDLSNHLSTTWSDRTIRYITFFGVREPSDLIKVRNNPNSTKGELATATFLTIAENTALFASRTLFRGYMIKGAFALIGYSISPLFGEAIAASYAANSKQIQTAHSVGTLGLWLLTLLAVKWM